jgi:hypothetical protein
VTAVVMTELFSASGAEPLLGAPARANANYPAVQVTEYLYDIGARPGKSGPLAQAR